MPASNPPKSFAFRVGRLLAHYGKALGVQRERSDAYAVVKGLPALSPPSWALLVCAVALFGALVLRRR